MTRKRWMILAGIVFMLALGIGLPLGLCDYQHPFSWPDLPPLEYGWPEADHILQVLPSDASYFSFSNLERVRQNDEWWLQWKQNRKESFWGQSWDTVDLCCQYHSQGCPANVELFDGDFDVASIASVLDQETGGPSHDYEGTRVWRTDQGSTAIINGIVITGCDGEVRRCLDVARAQSASAFDNEIVRGLLDHLIAGNGFNLMHVGGSTISGVYGEAYTVIDNWGVETDVYGYYDLETAKASALEVQRNIGPNDSDQVRRKVERDGVYVVITAVRRSEQYVDPVI